VAQVSKAKVFMSGRSQHVRIPAEYRFTSDEVYIRRDPQTGDVILSQAPADWAELYAALDKADFPEDFLADRRQGAPELRENRSWRVSRTGRQICNMAGN
jgi:antitoxin VapB